MQFRSSVFLWRIHPIHASPLLFLYSQLLTLDFNLFAGKICYCEYNCIVLITVRGDINKYSNIYPTRCNVTQFILSGNCSTCFGWYHHPSSGAQTTVSTASGICHTVTAICRYRGRVGTPIIRSANNCIYSIWYLSHRYCYLPLSWKS